MASPALRLIWPEYETQFGPAPVPQKLQAPLASGTSRHNILRVLYVEFFTLASAGSAAEVATQWDPPFIIFLQLLAIFALVLLNGFFVASEFALVKVRGSQLDALVDQEVRGASSAKKATIHLDAYLSATQLGITIASLGLGMLGERFLTRMLEPGFLMIGIQSPVIVHAIAVAIAFSMITFLHIVLGELAPKSLAIRRAVPVTLVIAKPMGFFHFAMAPLIWLFNGAANELLKRVLKIEPVGEHEMTHTDEELRLILAQSQKSNELTQLGHEIVINALDLKHRVVRDIMTPRGEVVFFDLDESFEENLVTANESQHTRYPLCRGHLDESVGLIHMKDVIQLMREGSKDLLSIKRELPHVSDMMPLEKLLKFFLTRRAHLAVAVDEFGGAVGIVTLDNVLAELVGDIQDEFDDAEQYFRKISEDEFDVDGSVPLYEMEDIADLELESSEVTTIGGHVTHLLGHLPAEGESVRIKDFEVTVTKTDGRRVVSLKLRRVKEPVANPDEPGKDHE